MKQNRMDFNGRGRRPGLIRSIVSEARHWIVDPELESGRTDPPLSALVDVQRRTGFCLAVDMTPPVSLLRHFL